MRCPICRKQVAFDDPEMPFCGKRCRLIDIGNWADEKYVFASEGMSEFEEQLDDDDGHKGFLQ